MLQPVDVGKRSLAAYRGVAPDGLLDELETVAAPLRGLRVLQLNATPYGGGVSELLRSAVPLLNDLGLVVSEAMWKGTRVVAGRGGGIPLFLLPRLLLDELALAAELVAARSQIAGVRQGHRDPVCGMAIGEGQDAPAETVAGVTYRFCSAECRARFRLVDPDRYRGPLGVEASGGG